MSDSRVHFETACPECGYLAKADAGPTKGVFTTHIKCPLCGYDEVKEEIYG